jgi:beta-barrel assembly-enhancing protease
MSKAKGVAWVAVAVAVGVVAALGLPRLARHVPWSIERWLGRIVDTSPAGTVCGTHANDDSLRAFDQLVRRIYPLDAEDRALPITIEAIGGKTVNAYATLGGHIYVFDGLLQQARTPEELAGVLAHEIAHVRNRHIIQGLMANLMGAAGLSLLLPDGSARNAGAVQALLSLKFSREQEAEADQQGLQRLRAAGVDAAGFGRFFARAAESSEPPAILSSHPSNDSRAELAGRFNGYPVTPVLTEAEWRSLKQLCVLPAH